MPSNRPTLEQSLDKAFGDYFAIAQRGSVIHEARAELYRHYEEEVDQFYQVQTLLRPLFGKEGLRPPDIGDHPDFGHLKGTSEVLYCPITTLFLDIESSTRMGILYSPEEVYRIKNAFIRAAIELIASFDGHVHRIMGDAVMAFFGGKNIQIEQSIIDALNCACVLRVFVERTVIPKLKAEGFTDPFGIRIGIDFGKADNVLWSSYGYPKSDEVTATSFYVDIAAKLQHSAGRNQIMIGQSLKEVIDFPENLLAVKQVQRGGENYDEPFVKPNHSTRDGSLINYKQYIVQWENYLRFTTLNVGTSRLLSVADEDGEIGAIPVTIDEHSSKEEPRLRNYMPCGYAVPKNHWVKFTLQRSLLPVTSYSVRYAVENHGTEAFLDKGEDMGNHITLHEVTNQNEHQTLLHWERTQYRGLHFMIVEVNVSGRLHSRTKIGIYVE